MRASTWILPHAQSDGCLLCSTVRSRRAETSACVSTSSRVSTTLTVWRSSQNGSVGFSRRFCTTASQRLPPPGRADSGRSSQNVSWSRFRHTAAKYAAAAESVSVR
ncbi:Uncharacterised protein [Mycobacteroides abscessus]|nr:Uncharacterised protein [Mycobacteroides abscessus]